MAAASRIRIARHESELGRWEMVVARSGRVAIIKETTMTENHHDRMPTMFPFLCYSDAPAAMKWLAEAFGFEELAVYPGPDGTIAHAEMKLGNGIIMLGSVKPGNDLGLKPAAELGGINQGIYIVVPDPDAHYHRARAAGATIVRELADMDYGSREYTARDPEGNIWSFGTYMPSGA